MWPFVGGEVVKPLDRAPERAVREKAEDPGTTTGFSSLRARTSGWPMIASSAYGPPWNSPSMAASVAG